ncbi:hypothetical protein CI109_105920 [Kwoniella shandongensis]|uniref:Uncharacterized protein n=1 Tax=Kwoniella shandongensis TaxID=1734106 RepID=A0A5M6BSP4_9TREE|nr:uncharacterized protein CI109_006650 [Kwoniella shandongensis]KAA5525010.1 hypothetical protein CI109_006650 [Kwoniella shandongensis]
MSMFNQFSFRPLDQFQAPRQSSSSPSINTSNANTPTSFGGIGSETPFEDESADESDSYPQSSSLSRFGSGRQSRSSITAVLEEDENEEAEQQQQEGVAHKRSQHSLHGAIPVAHHDQAPRHHYGHNLTPGLAEVNDRLDHLKSATVVGGKENMPDDHAPSSPQSFTGRQSRASPSPSRPMKLSALSPLQTLSPLQPVRATPSSLASSDTGSIGGRSRANSVTKSLSRRQSLIAHAEKWGRGDKFMDDDYEKPPDLFSRLTLVKAPAENTGIRRHNRSKSSSALSPFTTFAAASDSPATSNRGPRRSFAASSFGGISPLPIIRAIPDANEGLHRVQSLHSEEKGVQRKVYSPDEVVDIARSLSSPVMIPEGGFKGAELKRRKSAGASSRRGVKDSPEDRPPVALEPVEYVQMDQDVLLPFIDRPAEVTELIDFPANQKLFNLLKAAFPKDPARPNWREISPEEWNWEEFIKHLTKIDRGESHDYDWIFRARQAVRKRSVALWEKLGICLGCDGDLLNAGGEDDIPPSWGGLGLGDEGEYDPSMNQVWIEGLEAVDPDQEAAKAERDLLESFGEIVEDEGEQAAAGMTALLGPLDTISRGGSDIASKGSHYSSSPGRMTPAQRAGNKDKVDPFTSPSTQFNSLRHEPAQSFSRSPAKAGKGARESRSKSFVGLQICTSPISGANQILPRSPGSQLQTPVLGSNAPLPVYERGPGSPMFPSSFSSLSVEPNLGRSASVAVGGGVRPPAVQDDFTTFSRRGLVRKPSGAGLSESAITFASESDYSTSHVDAAH